MRINVIGYGTVGKAQALLLRRLKHEVFVFDPYLFPDVKCPEKNVDLTFICTPENVVDEAVQNLIKEHVDGLYVVKSTVSVGTTEELMKKYGAHISHNPEFLRENYANEDVVNPDRIIIGQCCKEHAEKLVSLYEPMNKPVFVTDPATSETAKLLSNSYLAMLITFWNEANELAEKLGLNIHEVAKLVRADHRVAAYGTCKFGEPFEGKCLPSNLEQLITAFHGAGLNPLLFEAIKKYNQRLSK
ncbi:UDP-glucose/GDP-mannose dehydrogenase family protein [Candidatus Bathyarchaeota archaeon]|nr:UDP-glucose/GDP-mannose dehydrogenase family protein [Candidatus Bathyarchaeota archaeon]